jgi:hypothetical protein
MPRNSAACSYFLDCTPDSMDFLIREYDFRERAAMFDHTVRGALSPLHTSRAPGFATQDHAQARELNAAQSLTQEMEATLANLVRKEWQVCCQTRRPSRPVSRIQPTSHGFS